MTAWRCAPGMPVAGGAGGGVGASGRGRGRYRGGMGMLGKLFDDGQLRDEGGEEGEGKVHHPRFNIDLDSGVVRLPGLAPKPAAGAEPDDRRESDDTAF